MINRTSAASKALKLLKWCTALGTVLMVSLLIWECIDIYAVGNSAENLDATGVYIQSVYRWEDVGMRLRDLLMIAIAYVVLVTLTAIAHMLFAEPRCGVLSAPDETRLRLMKSHVADLSAEANREERFRRRVWWMASAFIALCAVPCALYLGNRGNFNDWDLEMVVSQMMVNVAPWVMIAFGAAIAAGVLSGRSVRRELEALKRCPKARHDLENHDTAVPKGKSAKIARVVLYAIAALFILLGVMNGGLNDVLVKAINICTECIGLG